MNMVPCGRASGAHQVVRPCAPSNGTIRTHRRVAFKASNQNELAQTHQAGKGTCYLVGAGPGGVDYLTVKAMRLLERAKVVVYDDLGAQDVLDLVPATAERVYVGKRGGRETSIKQSEIDALLVKLCAEQGQDVVRLKGGCPAVFSRVGSEMAALAAAGCTFELVPGVSSALAAPLLAGFPLTGTQLAGSFAVLTGHDAKSIDWAGLRGAATLVILMGAKALPGITEALIQAGRSPDTPVSVIRSAGSGAEEQQVWWGTLATIVRETQGQSLSPCVIVIGQVVQLGALSKE